MGSSRFTEMWLSVEHIWISSARTLWPGPQIRITWDFVHSVPKIPWIPQHTGRHTERWGPKEESGVRGSRAEGVAGSCR